jgi:cell division protein FtsL
MTAARPLQRPAPRDGLRVVKGKRLQRLVLAPWMIMVIIGVVAFLGLGFARTSLDRSAFELDGLNRAIAEQEALNEQLRLEIARMENPARVAPLAEEMGLVIPGDTRQLLVDLDGGPAYASVEGEAETQ